MPADFHTDYYIVYSTYELAADSGSLPPPTCDDLPPAQQRQTHVFNIKETVNIAAVACPLSSSSGPWLPSEIAQELVAVSLMEPPFAPRTRACAYVTPPTMPGNSAQNAARAEFCTFCFS